MCCYESGYLYAPSTSSSNDSCGSSSCTSGELLRWLWLLRGIHVCAARVLVVFVQEASAAATSAVAAANVHDLYWDAVTTLHPWCTTQLQQLCKRCEACLRLAGCHSQTEFSPTHCALSRAWCERPGRKRVASPPPPPLPPRLLLPQALALFFTLLLSLRTLCFVCELPGGRRVDSSLPPPRPLASAFTGSCTFVHTPALTVLSKVWCELLAEGRVVSSPPARLPPAVALFFALLLSLRTLDCVV
jgi:hypothetical protein